LLLFLLSPLLLSLSPSNIIVMTWQLAPAIHPASSGSQWRGRVLGHPSSLYRGGGFVSGDIAALGCRTRTFGFLSSLSVVVRSFVIIILQPCCSPLSFSSLPIRRRSPASTSNPPHEQWLMRLGAGTQACCSFGCGGCFGGHNVVITEVEPKIRMKH
jgi:hypothetical protein